MYAPGSGIYLNSGNTISFKEHQNGYDHFSKSMDPKGDVNEELNKAAAGAGYDSISFVAHIDHVNYECDTHNTGNSGLDYMSLEVVACKLVGTYACGTATGAPSVIRAGWEASRPCTCDNKQQFTNCQGVPANVLDYDMNATFYT